MPTYKSTELEQLWQHKSGQVLFLDAIAPLDETDEAAEYRYSSQGRDMGSDSDFLAKDWIKIDESSFVGMPNPGLAHKIQQVSSNKAFNEQTRDEDLKRFPGNPQGWDSVTS